MPYYLDLILSIFFIVSFSFFVLCVFLTIKEIRKPKEKKRLIKLIIFFIISFFSFLSTSVILIHLYSDFTLKKETNEMISWTKEQMRIYDNCSSTFEFSVPYLQTEKSLKNFCFNKANGNKQKEKEIVSELFTKIKANEEVLSSFKKCIKEKTQKASSWTQNFLKLEEFEKKFFIKIGESCAKTILGKM